MGTGTSGQTTYQTVPDFAFAGMLADLHDIDTISRAFQGATSAAFGLALVQGTADDQCALPATANDVFLGVGIHRMIAPGTAGSNAFTGSQGIEATQNVDILKIGRIVVKIEQDVTMADPVYWRYTANGAGKDVGQFRKDADTAKAAQTTRARWAGTYLAAGLGLGVLDLNLP